MVQSRLREVENLEDEMKRKIALHAQEIESAKFELQKERNALSIKAKQYYHDVAALEAERMKVESLYSEVQAYRDVFTSRHSVKSEKEAEECSLKYSEKVTDKSSYSSEKAAAQRADLARAHIKKELYKKLRKQLVGYNRYILD